MDTVVLISNYNRKDFLRYTLESLNETADVPIVVVDDCSTDNPEEVTNKFENVDLVRMDENSGLRAVVDRGLQYIYEHYPDADFICYTENDIRFKHGWLQECIDNWRAFENDDKFNVGFISCHDSPEHPCPEENKESFVLDMGRGKNNYKLKPTERSTFLFASVKRWKEFGRIEKDPDKGPKPGRGSRIDWWLMGHPTQKYKESENSLRKRNEYILVMPGLAYHMGNIGSTWNNINPENDDFVNLIKVYKDLRGDLVFRFEPGGNREFWNLPNKKVGAFYLTHNEQEYVMQSLLSLQRLVDLIVIVDNGSTNDTLKMIDKFKKLKDSPEVIVEHAEKEETGILGTSTLNIGKTIDDVFQKYKDRVDWGLQMEPDLVLYEIPDDTLRKTATYLEMRGFNCLNIFMRDFIYDYAHISGRDWGEGPGNFYSERRFFKITPQTKIVNKLHQCVSNVKDKYKEYEEGKNKPHLYRFWTGWRGNVAKTRYIKFAHYGLCRGVERIRLRTYYRNNQPFVFWDECGFAPSKDESSKTFEACNTTYQYPRIPFKGKHPKFMCVDYG